MMARRGEIRSDCTGAVIGHCKQPYTMTFGGVYCRFRAPFALTLVVLWLSIRYRAEIPFGEMACQLHRRMAAGR